MEKEIFDYIDSLFDDLPDTPAVKEAKSSIAEKAIKEYYILIKAGYDEASAYQAAIKSIDDVTKLKEELKKRNRRSALPKSVQDYADLDNERIVKASFRSSGNGKVVAIGCITGLLIFIAIVVAIILISLAVFRSLSPETLENIENFKPSEVIEDVRERIHRKKYGGFLFDDDFDFYTDIDDVTVSGTQGDKGEVSVSRSWGDEHESFNVNYNADGEYTVYANGAKNLEIDWVAGKVTIIAEDRNNVLIKEDSDENDPICYGVRNKTLYIYYRDKFIEPQRKMNIKSVTIRVPKEFMAGLDDFEINTVSADCSIKDAEFYDLDFETVSGSLNIESVCCEVDFNSVSGNLTYIGSACPNKVEVSTISGDTALFFNGGDGFKVEFETISGKLDSDYTLNKVHDQYFFGNGSAEIEVESTSGDLEIKRK